MQQTPQLGEANDTSAQDLALLGTVDIVAGVPTFNNAETVQGVIEAVGAGLAQHFSGQRFAIIQADGGSGDDTNDRVRAAAKCSLLQVTFPVYPAHKLVEYPTAMPGKASALRTIFELAGKLDAKVCAVVGGDLKGVSPDWVDLMARPVLESEFDLALPYFRRHKFDGAITNGILYPIVRSLYGKSIRQPLAGEFAASIRLVRWYLEQEAWDDELIRHSADYWLTARAAAGGFRICQAVLGEKVHDGGPAPDLSAVLSYVLGSVFEDIQKNAAVWQKVRGCDSVPVFGPATEFASDPAHPNLKRMVDSYRLGYRDLLEIWGKVLSPGTLLELKRLSQCPEENFLLQDEVWVHCVYDFALAYRLRTIGREHLLRAITPLYLGWLASFVREMWSADSAEVQERLDRLCVVYEKRKPYLISRWRWPDRFNP